MKFKYVAMTKPPRADIYYEGDGGTFIPQLLVYEREDTPQPTGLFDASGVKLYRVRERLRMGF